MKPEKTILMVLAAAVLLTACSQNQPPKAVVDNAVNWDLSKHTAKFEENARTYRFLSYKLQNLYSENKGADTYFVYDYVAEVPVKKNFNGDYPLTLRDDLKAKDGIHDKFPLYELADANDKTCLVRSIECSVTVYKKGTNWYFKRTER